MYFPVTYQIPNTIKDHVYKIALHTFIWKTE